MEEGLTFAIRAKRRVMHSILQGNTTSQISWARWCLPSFSATCNQDLKGHMADADNSWCDSLVREYEQKKKNRDQKYKDMCPWESPTALVFWGDGFGM